MAGENIKPQKVKLFVQGHTTLAQQSQGRDLASQAKVFSQVHRSACLSGESGRRNSRGEREGATSSRP